MFGARLGTKSKSCTRIPSNFKCQLEWEPDQNMPPVWTMCWQPSINSILSLNLVCVCVCVLSERNVSAGSEPNMSRSCFWHRWHAQSWLWDHSYCGPRWRKTCASWSYCWPTAPEMRSTKPVGKVMAGQPYTWPAARGMLWSRNCSYGYELHFLTHFFNIIFWYCIRLMYIMIYICIIYISIQCWG